MVVPFSVVVIKPMTVGRGDAPSVLSDILAQCPVSLRKFRAWRICDSTWKALAGGPNIVIEDMYYEFEKIHAFRPIDSWICLFTHNDRVTDPTTLLNECCGPVSSQLMKPRHIKYKYGGLMRAGAAHHPSDTVVHISCPNRAQFEALLLFENFNDEII